MNKIILIGRLTRDPQLRTIQGRNGQTNIVNFTLAVNRTFTNSKGEREADFINCVAYNKIADLIAQYVKKGHRLSVEGRLQTRSYQAKDGSMRYVSEVIIENMKFLETKNATNLNQLGNAPYNFQQQPQTNATNGNTSYNQPAQMNQAYTSPNTGYNQPYQTQQVAETQQPTYNQPNEPTTNRQSTYDFDDDDLPF